MIFLNIALLSVNLIYSQPTENEAMVIIHSDCTPFIVRAPDALVNLSIENKIWHGYLPKGEYNFKFQCNNKTLSQDIEIQNERDKYLHIFVNFDEETVKDYFISDKPMEISNETEEIKNTDNGDCSEEAFIIVEDMPKFEGSKGEDFDQYIAKSIKYPQEAKNNGMEGKVYVRFTVNCHGEVVNVIIVRSVDSILDKEALRVINSSPLWIPGKQRGVPVNVQFTYPIQFSIN